MLVSHGVAVVRWLLAPMSGVARHDPPAWMVWHGRLMVVARTIALPLGAPAARFGKTPRRSAWPARLDDLRWCQVHRAVQSAGPPAMVAAAAIALLHAPGAGTAFHARGAGTAGRAHHVLGWIVIGAGCLQGVSALLRGTKGAGPPPPGRRSASRRNGSGAVRASVPVDDAVRREERRVVDGHATNGPVRRFDARAAFDARLHAAIRGGGGGGHRA